MWHVSSFTERAGNISLIYQGFQTGLPYFNKVVSEVPTLTISFGGQICTVNTLTLDQMIARHPKISNGIYYSRWMYRVFDRTFNILYDILALH